MGGAFEEGEGQVQESVFCRLFLTFEVSGVYNIYIYTCIDIDITLNDIVSNADMYLTNTPIHCHIMMTLFERKEIWKYHCMPGKRFAHTCWSSSWCHWSPVWSSCCYGYGRTRWSSACRPSWAPCNQSCNPKGKDICEEERRRWRVCLGGGGLNIYPLLLLKIMFNVFLKLNDNFSKFVA